MEKTRARKSQNTKSLKMDNKKIKTIEVSININNKADIVDRLKQAYGFKTNSELSEFLGTSLPNISNWKARNSIDWTLIIEKCANKVNINWLATGKGNALIDDKDNDTLKEQIGDLKDRLIESLNENGRLLKELSKK